MGLSSLLIICGLALLGTLLACFLAWEGYWRAKGWRPSVSDDRTIWGLVRQSKKLQGPGAIALVGASRMQTALNPRQAKEICGVEPVMLAIDGSAPYAVLADLATDRNFSGTVLCSLLPMWLGAEVPAQDRAAKWVRKTRHQSWLERQALQILIFLQSRLVSLHPNLAASKVIRTWRSGRALRPPFNVMQANRYRRSEFDPITLASLKRSRAKREKRLYAASQPLPPTAFDARLAQVQRWADAIEARGGRVIWLRLPSSGAVRELEQAHWPRQTYWDRLARRRPSVSIHCDDHPTLSGFTCPDGSHLDGPAADRFTRALIHLLQQKKLIRKI
jgi:hypothetical protein